jgi:hypothetical protein
MSRRRWFRSSFALLVIVGVATGWGCASTRTVTVPVENGITVKLQGQDPDPKSADLRRGNGKDHVRWHNPGTVDRTITFVAGWPFMETQEPIVIPAGKWSAWFTLAPPPITGDYPYQINPPLGGPPEGPVVSAGD